jgi:hypothetical protein
MVVLTRAPPVGKIKKRREKASTAKVKACGSGNEPPSRVHMAGAQRRTRSRGKGKEGNTQQQELVNLAKYSSSSEANRYRTHIAGER